jgi:predicted house-cleaning noncanonical NTP pyrophosphatase (MazG superfamily)
MLPLEKLIVDSIIDIIKPTNINVENGIITLDDFKNKFHIFLHKDLAMKPRLSVKIFYDINKTNKCDFHSCHELSEEEYIEMYNKLLNIIKLNNV